MDLLIFVLLLGLGYCIGYFIVGPILNWLYEKYFEK